MNYDWDVVKKHHAEIKRALNTNQIGANNIGIAIQANYPLILRVASHLALSEMSKTLTPGVTDMYMFSMFAFGISVFATAPTDITISIYDSVPYLIDKIGDGVILFKPETVDEMMEQVYKSILPYLADITNEYKLSEINIGNVPHALKVSKFFFAGLLIGFAMLKSKAEDNPLPVSWFSDYERYCTELYNTYIVQK